MGIDWVAFDWQSFAMLAAGAMAAIAATIIGLRQTGITRRQTEILERQVNLEDLSLRHELFDRRYTVYDATKRFLLHILQEAQSPDHGSEIERTFLTAIGESRFLFRPAVHNCLDDIWQRSCDFWLLKTEMAQQFDREGHYGDGNSQKAGECLKRFNYDLQSLHDLFGAEMVLSPNI